MLVGEAQVQTSEIKAAESAKAAAKTDEKLKELATQADDYLKKIQNSYRTLTSIGLAQSFKTREVQLNNSMLIWVLGLMASLLLAAAIGKERFPEIAAAIKGTPDWGVVMVNVTLATLSLSPAIWFAWVATMQIGQRFRLAEDYAYKAAISAAYEGYRTEAANLDPLLQAQLFASALGRLDELPLRLISGNVAGSPFHELLQSKEFKEAAKFFPGLMDRAIEALRRKPKSPNQEPNAAPKESDKATD